MKKKKEPAPKPWLLPEPLENASPDRPLCQKCGLWKTAKTPFMMPEVPDDWDGELAAIGEAPGWHEDEVSGKPFTGKSGQLLRKLLRAAGFKTYLLHNTARCRPLDNATPTMVQVRCCRPFLLEVLRKYQPKKVLGVGTTPAKALTDDGQANVTGLRGRPITIIGDLS